MNPIRISALLLALISTPLFANKASNQALDACMRQLVVTAEPSLTIAKLRSTCSDQIKAETQMHQDIREIHAVATDAETQIDPATSIQERRERLEEVSRLNPFTITAHKPNYLFPATWNFHPNQEPFVGTNNKVEEPETQFQISLKIPLMVEMFNAPVDLYLAYTNTSWWQVFNTAESRPFRETNHEPELFLDWKTGWHFMGVDTTTIRFGVNHQSNGRDLPFSRSWNRIFAQFILSTDKILFSFQPWWRVPEEDKTSPTDTTGDENPNIEQFAGQAEFLLGYQWHENNFVIRHRSNLRADYRGGLELNWSFPLNKRVRGYLRYYDGYGESLIDYNAYTQRIGLGFMLTDWL